MNVTAEVTNIYEQAETRDASHPCSAIVGDSLPIQSLRHMIARVGRSTVPVLINGPSGAGKELVARAIHASSRRADRPFVAINCGAIPPELIESELFGHERGSFTGAIARRIGRFEEANGGTLFLDEIGDMRFDMQVKLLRVLEEKVIQRVGGNGQIDVDVRVVSATHRDIAAEISAGRFREDLFFRLGVISMVAPSLAERIEDLPLLVRHFQKRSDEIAKAGFTPEALTRLQDHNWPGNVRELRNVVARANVLFAGEEIDVEKVEQLLGRSPLRTLPLSECIGAATARSEATRSEQSPINLREMIEAIELERIAAALHAADGVVSEAARLLTLKRTTLIEKMRRYRVAA